MIEFCVRLLAQVGLALVIDRSPDADEQSEADRYPVWERASAGSWRV